MRYATNAQPCETGRAACPHAADNAAIGHASACGRAACPHAAVPIRKRLNHRGPLSIDVSSAWYFITICAEGHAPWVVDDGRAACPHAAVPFDEIARMVLSAAKWYHEHGKWRLALFLVMPDHLHFIAHFPDGGVGTRRPTVMETVVGEFKKYLSRQLKIRFQRDFFETRLRDDAHLAEKHVYILGNPVRKGLCAEPSDWPHVMVFNRETGVGGGGVGTRRPTVAHFPDGGVGTRRPTVMETQFWGIPRIR